MPIAIFLGVVIGTYSSIYISSPVLVWLGVQPDSFLKTDEKEDARGAAGLTRSARAKLAPSKLTAALGLSRSPR